MMMMMMMGATRERKGPVASSCMTCSHVFLYVHKTTCNDGILGVVRILDAVVMLVVMLDLGSWLWILDLGCGSWMWILDLGCGSWLWIFVVDLGSLCDLEKWPAVRYVKLYVVQVESRQKQP